MNKFFEFFKENKEIVILIPALLGGLYQILNIVILVGMPYIRYFSVSQVIPDGLLICISIFWLYIAIKIILSLYKKLISSNESTVQHHWLFNSFYIVLLLSLGIFFLYTTLQEEEISSFSSIIVRYLGYAFSLLLIWSAIKQFLIVTEISLWLKSKTDSMNNETKDLYFKILSIIFLFAIVKFVPNEIAIINQIFIKVNNMENYSPFIKSIQETYNMPLAPELIYINKEYAFFKVHHKSDQILVLEATSLTEFKPNKDE